MKSLNIAIIEPGYANYETERTVLSGLNVNVIPVSTDCNLVDQLTAIDPVIVLLRERQFKGPQIDACANLRGIVRYGVGVDNVDIDYAKSKQIYVANVPDYGAEIEVSEHALALYLAVQRRLISRDSQVRDRLWGVGQDAIIPSREDSVLGLVGCGKIGLQTASKFRALGFKTILAFDPYLSNQDARQNNIQKVNLNELCAQADVVSLHAPLTPETHHIIGQEMFDLMQQSTILINVSRGGLVDEGALANALTRGQLFGAGIDVFESEPVSSDNPLLTSPNTILTDHTAWYSERSVRVLQRKAAEAAYQILTNKEPANWVNPWQTHPKQ
ncbi:MAG: C-terminal binding protein [Oceanospirillaceae bacterium]|nr:C-terminal binding protein [Oceanospirillaceae bacterium]